MSRKQKQQQELDGHIEKVKVLHSEIVPAKKQKRLEKLLEMEGFVEELKEWMANDKLAQSKGIHLVKRAIWDLGLGEELMKAVVKGGPKFETKTTERIFKLLNFSCESRGIVEVVLEMDVIHELLVLVLESLEGGHTAKLEALEEMGLDTLCVLCSQGADLCFELASRHGMLLSILQLSADFPNVQFVAVELLEQICIHGGAECVGTLMENDKENEEFATELLMYVSVKEELDLVNMVVGVLFDLGKESREFVGHLQRFRTKGLLEDLVEELNPMMRTNRAARQVAEQAEKLVRLLDAHKDDDHEFSGTDFRINDLVEEKAEYTEDTAAVKLQSVFRGHQERKRRKQEEEEQHRAAIKVQSRARGMIARRQFKQLQVDSEFDRERSKHERRIQRHMNTLKDLENTPAEQVSSWQGMQVHLTVMRVQAHWRGLVQRRKYREMRARMTQKDRHDKARIIQKAYRGYSGRRQARMAIQNANQPRVYRNRDVKELQDKVLLQLSLRHYGEEDYRVSKDRLAKEIEKHKDMRVQSSVSANRRQKLYGEIDRTIEGISFVEKLSEMSLTDLDEVVEGLPHEFTVGDHEKENFERKMEYLRKTQARLRYVELMEGEEIEE